MHESCRCYVSPKERDTSFYQIGAFITQLSAQAASSTTAGGTEALSQGTVLLPSGNTPVTLASQVTAHHYVTPTFALPSFSHSHRCFLKGTPSINHMPQIPSLALLLEPELRQVSTSMALKSLACQGLTWCRRQLPLARTLSGQRRLIAAAPLQHVTEDSRSHQWKVLCQLTSASVDEFFLGCIHKQKCFTSEDYRRKEIDRDEPVALCRHLTGCCVSLTSLQLVSQSLWAAVTEYHGLGGL